MTYKNLILASVFAISLTTGVTTLAETVGNDMKVSAKKGVRNIKDKTCEMINGKMECAAKKVGHKIQNATDEVKK